MTSQGIWTGNIVSFTQLSKNKDTLFWYKIKIIQMANYRLTNNLDVPFLPFFTYICKRIFNFFIQTSCAFANRSPTLVILMFVFCPVFAPSTNTTNPWILAIPSPLLLTSDISTSYSFPISTGFGPPKPLL